MFTYKNAKILVNNKEIAASTVDFNIGASLTPIYDTTQRHSFDYAATNGIGGSLRLNYYLTGQDFLKDFVTNETDIISGNFGGLFFKSGYLKNYSLNGEPNKPITIDAEIVFFDELKGIFTQNNNISNPIIPLNFSDTEILIGNGNKIGNLDNILGFSYNFTSDIQPVYTVDSSLPESVNFGIKEITLELQTDNLSGDLPITGKITNLTFNFKDTVGITQENISCSGNLFQRNIETSTNEIIASTLTVQQNFVDNIPMVSGFSPLSGYAGAWIRISGEGFENITKVFFHDTEDNQFILIDENTISGKIPNGAITGPIRVQNFGGIASSTGDFIVNQSGITVSSVNPITGEIGNTIQILGNNFYRISDVLFGTGISSFSTVNGNTLYATIPQTAVWGKINVISNDRNISGQSIQNFVPYPKITGFNPPSGISGNNITVLGYAFSGVTTATINGISSSITVNSNNQATIVVPSGNPKGVIRLFGQSGVSGISNTNFKPHITITGIHPNTGQVGHVIAISGAYFFNELMYPVDDGFLVSFNGGTGKFFKQSNLRLTGVIPTGATSGNVYIVDPDFAIYPSNISFNLVGNPPIISNIIPSSGQRGQDIAIQGENFFAVNAVKITGPSGITTITGSQVSSLGNFIGFSIPSVTGGNYDVTIETLGGNTTASSALTVLENPFISGFTPLSGVINQTITLSGGNLYPNSKIYVENTGIETIVDSGSFTPQNNYLEFKIPFNCPDTGKIIVYNSIGYATGNGFTLISGPTISGFEPLTGDIGDTIRISGSSFNGVISGAVGDITGTFSLVGTTGLHFIVPENAQTDFINLHSLGGIVSSDIRLTVLDPLIVISGFQPTGLDIGDTLHISGSRFDTILEVYFTGSTGEIQVLNTEFINQNSTGISITVPPDTQDGLVKLVNLRSGFYTSEELNILDLPTINTITPESGIYNDIISISGDFDNVDDFLFQGTNEDAILSLNTVFVGSTGATIQVPKNIMTSPIFISGLDKIRNISNNDFIPLPTISGFSPLSLNTGDILIITGINAIEIGFVGITGDGELVRIFDSFTGDHSRVIGDNILTSETGYSIISGKVNGNFAGTGKLFFAHELDINSGVFRDTINDISSNQILTVNPGAPTISSFTPESGNYNTAVTINGTVLNTVTGINIVSGANIQTGAVILNKTFNSLTFNPPTGIIFTSQTSGQIRATSEFGSATSNNYFTFIDTPQISGFFPTTGITGQNIIISGSGLRNVTELYFGDTLTTFTRFLEDGTYKISGKVPNTDEILPKNYTIKAINTAGTGISSNQFTILQGPINIYGDVNIIGGLGVSGTLSPSGGFATDIKLRGNSLTQVNIIEFTNGGEINNGIITDDATQPTINFWDRYLNDILNQTSLDWQNRILYGNWSIDGSGNLVTGNSTIVRTTGNQIISGQKKLTAELFVDTIYDFDGIYGVDLATSSLRDNIENSSLNWQDRQLIISDGNNISLDWENRVLSGNWGISGKSLATDDSTIVRTIGTQSISGIKTFSQSAFFNDSVITNDIIGITDNLAGIRVSSGHLYFDPSQQITLDWKNRILSGNWTLDGTTTFNNPILTDSIFGKTDDNVTISLAVGQLSSSLYGTTLDWQNRILSGNWRIPQITGSLSISGDIISSSYDTFNSILFTQDVAYTGLTSGILSFPDNANIVYTSGSITGVSNVMAGAVYYLVASGATTLTNNFQIICPTGNISLNKNQSITAIGLNSTGITIPKS